MTKYRDEVRNVAEPRIDFIDPTSVRQNDEVPLSVVGANFNDSSFVFIDGHSPRVEHISDSQLKVSLVREITGSTGPKSVKVHNSDTGDLSNEKILTVEALDSSKRK